MLAKDRKEAKWLRKARHLVAQSKANLAYANKEGYKRKATPRMECLEKALIALQRAHELLKEQVEQTGQYWRLNDFELCYLED